MVRIADLMYRALKLAWKRWYVVMTLLLIGVSPILIVTWRVHNIQVAIAQLKKDNPQVNDWNIGWIGLVDEVEEVNGDSIISMSVDKTLSDIGEFKDLVYFKEILGRDLDMSLYLLSVSDISALKGMKLTKLSIPSVIENIEWLKGVKTIKKINKKPVAEFWKEYDAKKVTEQKTNGK